MFDYPEELLEPAPSHIMGPTWRKYKDGGFFLPEKSLGWDLINWYAEYCRQPGGPDSGKPFIPTLEQARFLVWWYAVDEHSGRFIFRNGNLRRLKGWGKDPLAGVMALGELCGPVEFSHWDANGNPVGKRKGSPWIQIAAVSQDQTRNTFTLFPALISPELKQEFGLDINKTIIYTRDGGMIEGVTSSPLSLEGKRPTFVIKNETQWWVETNDGHAMSEVIQGNVDKAAYGSCRSLAICNGHIPGQESDAEQDYDTYQKVQAGEVIDTGFLYDALEAPADTPLSEIPSPKEEPEAYAEGVAKLREGLIIARGDAVWLDLDVIIASMLDIRRPVTESRRKFLNQINAHEDAWISPQQWDACDLELINGRAIREFVDALPEGMDIESRHQEIEAFKESLTATKLAPREKITMGFDGSKTGDHTALVACRVSDGALFLLKHWNPENCPGEEIPREEVDAVVRSAFETYNVVGFRADVKEFEAYVDQWGKDFRRKVKVNASPNSPIAFDMRGQTKRFSLDCERFCDAVLEGELAHDGNKIMRQHVLNAHRYPTTFDTISIRKASKDSSRKIDIAVCCVLAYGARQDFLMSKKNRGSGMVVMA